MPVDRVIPRLADFQEPVEPLWDGFESLESAISEDIGRAASTANLARDIVAGRNDPAAALLDPCELRDLSNRLAEGVETGRAPHTLASSTHMRLVRHATIGAILRAFEPYPELVTTTVLKDAWCVRPQELLALNPTRFKNQFLADLKRTGVADHPDPLVAFFHGEFEPTSGTIPLHVHLATTPGKAALLREGFRRLGGYPLTATGSPAIRRSPVRDPARQLSYLLKSDWPQKAGRVVDGKLKRDRDPHRIGEPYHSHVLLWLDRQRLRDLTITNRTWSPRLGGSDAWRDFYLLVQALR